MDAKQTQQRVGMTPHRASSLVLSTIGWIAGALGVSGLGWATYLVIVYVRFHSFDTRHGGLPTLMAGGGLAVVSSVLLALGILLLVIGRAVGQPRKENAAVEASTHT